MKFLLTVDLGLNVGVVVLFFMTLQEMDFENVKLHID
jgi:hypothetical protein